MEKNIDIKPNCPNCHRLFADDAEASVHVCAVDQPLGGTNVSKSFVLHGEEDAQPSPEPIRLSHAESPQDIPEKWGCAKCGTPTTNRYSPCKKCEPLSFDQPKQILNAVRDQLTDDEYNTFLDKAALARVGQTGHKEEDAELKEVEARLAVTEKKLLLLTRRTLRLVSRLDRMDRRVGDAEASVDEVRGFLVLD